MPPEAQTIEMLMQQALGGDKAAYTFVLGRSAQMVRPYLNRHLNIKSEIDDVVQEILISVHKSRHTYNGMRPYAPWLFAIARYRLHDYLRVHYKDHLRHATEISVVENSLSGDVTESGISYESVKGEIRNLPEKQATILQLMHEEGYTAKQVADKIGMTESAVKVSAHRAYKLLRKKLEG